MILFLYINHVRHEVPGAIFPKIILIWKKNKSTTELNAIYMSQTQGMTPSSCLRWLYQMKESIDINLSKYANKLNMIHQSPLKTHRLRNRRHQA